MRSKQWMFLFETLPTHGMWRIGIRSGGHHRHCTCCAIHVFTLVASEPLRRIAENPITGVTKRVHHWAVLEGE